MIISRAPLRISLGGGGTDLPSYFEKYEGFLLAGAINKYIFTSAHKPFYKAIKIRYSTYEDVNNVNEIKHNLFREALKLYDIQNCIELSSIADIPSGTGLGSSGAFLVSLLNTLHLYKYNKESIPRELARKACLIEINILKEHEGKQDKYASAFGGVKAYTFHEDGTVSITPLINEDLILKEMSDRLFIFYTGLKRKGKTSDYLKTQDERGKKKDKQFLNYMHEIKDIAIESKLILESLNFDRYGELLDEHWEIKKQYAPHSTNDKINSLYKSAIESGALGGKIMGAPGGGFFIFYHPGTEKEKWSFISNMEKLNLQHVEYEFDNQGVKTIWR